MGQRHQLYFVLPNERHDSPRRVVGLHHQWLYGSRPLATLKRVLDTVALQAAEQYTWWNRTYIVDDNQPDYVAHHALMAIAGLEADGSFTTLYPLTHGETTDPRKGDNNDGITIVDMRDPANVKFAFATFTYAPNTDWRDTASITAGQRVKVMGAADYLAGYYTRDSSDADKQAPDGAWAMADALDALPRLSRADVRKLFPAMFPRKSKVAA